ncbi:MULTISPECIES: hypothetical protein [unclassified Campylobacter]|uniref:hypothetical protein n=1 Tax=unclassified Campylobacter TaxID=2593542 RepID=UPI001BDB1482|nr:MULTISPECIES: hypothetical protein [unclassified Campylobacter]MBT0880292.1 hypothetical protein [Campylobacter sp. 2018MI27]MBT0884575.1 hypothetical protein [Campylobacter sp. 2018MI10]
MKIRNFLIYSILYLMLIGLIIVIFFNDLFNSTRVINLGIFNFQKTFEFDSFTWVCMPLVIYVIFALLYFYFSFISFHFSTKRLIKDGKKFEMFLEDLVLDKKNIYKFKTKEFQDASELVKSLYYNQAGTSADKLNNAIAIKAMVENGEICDLKPFKLSKDNTIYLKNEANKAKNDLNYAYNLLKNQEEIQDEISLSAYNNLILNGIYANIKTLKIQKSKEDIKILLNRFANDDLSLSNAELEVLIFNDIFEEGEYLDFAKELFAKIEPNSLKAIFLKLKNEKDNAFRAYLYILAKLALFDELIEEIYGSEADLEDFKLIVFLKEQGKTYDVDKLIC